MRGSGVASLASKHVFLANNWTWCQHQDCVWCMLLNYLYLRFAPPMHHMVSVCESVGTTVESLCCTVQQSDVYISFHETWPLHACWKSASYNML